MLAFFYHCPFADQACSSFSDLLCAVPRGRRSQLARHVCRPFLGLAGAKPAFSLLAPL